MNTPNRRRPATFLTLVALAAVTTWAAPALAAGPVHWDLTPIFASDEGWHEARERLAASHGRLAAFRGKLGDSAASLRGGLDTLFELRMQASSLSAYAGMRGDEDLRDSAPQGMRQSLRSVLAEAQAAAAWFDPEVLEIPPERLRGFVESEAGLAIYRRYLERLEERRPHVLGAESERLMGMTQRIRGTGSTIAELLRNAEIPWPTIQLSDGSDLRVDSTGYVRGRALPQREDRVAAYDAFYGQLQAFRGSLAASLSATVQEHILAAQARSYASSLEAALAENEVNPAVYGMLIQEMNAALPTLHRYFRLRGRMLGIDDLRYHDIYPDLVEDVGGDYDWERSKRVATESLRALGDEYADRFLHALNDGWVDVYPRQGKRSGAYVQDGAYGVHPYMLLNHQDDYNSLSTLVHEGGHLMHSWYSQEAQPYPTSSYTIFVAEVASTFNQVFLFRTLLERAEDDDLRLALLGHFLEDMRGTVFRQTMFAEFELAIHEAAERGEPLTGDALNALYLDLLRRYHGEAQSVMKIDELYAAEWAYIPHFHYNFYVYQYATSYVAAIALHEGVQRDPAAMERYLAFLRSGSSRPPVDLLRDAGVDMTGPEPIRAAVRMMNDVMDRMDAILDRR